jgi:methionyl-tRNA formyltransferase
VSVAFFGSSELGADALQALVAAGVEIGAVVTQPDRQAGRGRKLRRPPVAERADALGLPLIQTADASADPPAARAGVVVAFGQIVRPPLLGGYPLYNLHPSLLPRWRGAAPIERALMAGDAETGVAVIELVAELDAGPVHGMARFPIGEADDAGDVAARALELGVPLLVEALSGRTTGVPQPAEGVTYAAKLTAADRELDWDRSAAELDRRVRALSPHIGARTLVDGRMVAIWRARPIAEGPGAGEIAQPLVIGCGEGALDVSELQPAGGRRMTAAEFLRGLRVPPSRAGG